MKRSSFVGLLSGTLLVSTAVPSFSAAFVSVTMPDGRPLVRVTAENDGSGAPLDGDPTAFLLLAQADIQGENEDVGPPENIGPPDIPHGASGPALHIAARLAAAETYVGITSGQLDAWRAYASALIGLVDGPKPERDRNGPRRHRPDHQRGERADGAPPAEGVRSEPADRPLLTERLADGAIDRGEKAEALKAAIAALRTTLTPDQTARLRDAERSFLPPGPPGSGVWDAHQGGGHHDGYDDVPMPPLPWGQRE